MKLTIFLFTFAFMQVYASGSAQSITLSGKNIPLEKICAVIKQQTGYVVSGDFELMTNSKPLSLSVANMPLADFLHLVLDKQELTYHIRDKNIILSRKPPAPTGVLTPIFPIAGQILDIDGKPIPGVSVRVLQSKFSTATDDLGRFSLTGIGEGTTLEVSAIGFLPLTIRLTGNTFQVISSGKPLQQKEPPYLPADKPSYSAILNASPSAIIIQLAMTTSDLNEVVVSGGYYQTTNRLKTGNITKITSEEIMRQPVSNPMLALEGKVAGLFITQNAGYAGANMTVSIRGQNSLSSNSPLYVVDGVPFGSTPVEQSAGGFATGIGFSPLNTISPSEIENIYVLKDADATAIYGSRGANGVILITTKKGRAGNTQFNVDVSSGIGSVTHTIPMLSTQQYLDIRKQAFANDGVTPTTVNAPDLTLWDPKAATNFADLLIGQTSHQSKATVNISGGDQYTQFLFGGTYRHESTVYYTSTADNAAQFHLNLQHKSHDGKFNMNVSTSYNADNNTIPNYSLSTANSSLPPNYPLYNPDGSLYFATGYTNPLAAFHVVNNLKTDNLMTNAGLHYTLLPGLDINASLGYNRINVEGAIITPSAANNPLNNSSQQSVLNSNYIKTYIMEPQLNYTHTWGKGKLNALIGGTWQQTQSIQPYFVLGTFTNIALAKSLGGLTVLVKSSAFTDYKYVSGFGRLAYDWDGKYLISGNLRRDGSSRFGANRQFGTFGSIAGAWIFSKEDFIKNNLPWLSFGKIKSGYGTVGNDKIVDYSYESTYNTLAAYGTVSGLVPTRITNPYLQWEVTKKLDAGIELGFIQDRLFISADYYRNRSSSLLGTTGLPSQVGFTFYSNNLPGTVQNKGVELELTTVNIKKSGGFTWSSSLNLTIPNNKLLSFPGLQQSSYANTYVIGQSLNPISAYHFTGFKDGIATVQDMDKNGVISYGLYANGKGDLVLAGNTDPKIYGGLNNTFNYKGFQLDILFQFVQRKALRGDLYFSSYPGFGYNMPVSMLNVPLKYSATAGSVPSKARSYYTGSDAAIEDASFIRLKNVSLAYRVPQAWAKRMKLSSLQIYLHGQNLLTFTKYKGLDPEILNANLPTLNMLVAGIQITF